MSTTPAIAQPTPERLASLERQVSDLASELAAARTELVRLDDFANGILAALMIALPLLLKRDPFAAPKVMSMLAEADQTFERACAGEHTEQSASALEARKILYRVMQLLGVPEPASGNDAGKRSRTRRRPVASSPR